jgi:hypothetical protein
MFNMFKYWNKVRVKSGFYEGSEFIIIKYCRWIWSDENYNQTEIDYSIKQNEIKNWVMWLIPQQRLYKIYDCKLKCEIEWPEHWWFLESDLELIK